VVLEGRRAGRARRTVIPHPHVSSRGADVGGVSPSTRRCGQQPSSVPAQMWEGVSPVPADCDAIPKIDRRTIGRPCSDSTTQDHACALCALAQQAPCGARPLCCVWHSVCAQGHVLLPRAMVTFVLSFPSFHEGATLA
jgi:hypothetical protein